MMNIWAWLTYGSGLRLLVLTFIVPLIRWPSISAGSLAPSRLPIFLFPVRPFAQGWFK